MSALKKSVIPFDSANGSDQVTGFFYADPGQKPKAVIQISHGMCEYIGRYEDFIAFLVDNGYAVCGNDHLGHGETSAQNGTDGFFSGKDGKKHVLQDLHHMNRLAAKEFPGVPLLLLGHSMGSFFARWYATVYPETLHALIISGTGGPNPLGKIGIALTSVLMRLRGPQHRSALIHNMAFGAYLKQIENPKTPYDWISRDAQIVSAYANDVKCTFQFTVEGFHELMSVLDTVSKPEWAEKMPKELPVLFVSGDKDPVGDYGKGVQLVYQRLVDAGVQDVQLKLYEGGRHEMLNEINRQEVYADILNWCNAHVPEAHVSSINT